MSGPIIDAVENSVDAVGNSMITRDGKWAEARPDEETVNQSFAQEVMDAHHLVGSRYRNTVTEDALLSESDA